jgi:hypothetical protein
MDDARVGFTGPETDFNLFFDQSQPQIIARQLPRQGTANDSSAYDNNVVTHVDKLFAPAFKPLIARR